jgi:hypothetical protein
MSRLISLGYLERLSPLKRSELLNSISPAGLCVSLVTILIVMGANEAKSHLKHGVRLSEDRFPAPAIVGTCRRPINMHKAQIGMSEIYSFCEGSPSPSVAQNVYGPVPLDGAPVQPGYMPGPTGFPPTQPSSMPAPTGFPGTQPGYAPPGITGAPPAQVAPNPTPTAIPPNQAGYGSRTLDPSGTETMNTNTVLRATNTARMRSEALNGGLRVYRTASCMYQQSGGECLIQRNSEGYLFRFLGGEPGWQQLGKAPSMETEILIGPDGKSVTKLLYNGPPRGSSSAVRSPPGTQQPATIQP